METVKEENADMLRQYRRMRKISGLSDWQESRVEQLICDWKLYRSNKSHTVFIAYGIYEIPTFYLDEKEIDKWIEDEIESLDDDFEWCVEKSTRTGRQLGELLAYL